MLSDDELPAMPDYLSPGTVHEYARAVERAAYERAARECDPHEDDDRIDRQIKLEIAERIRALGRQLDCSPP